MRADVGFWECFGDYVAAGRASVDERCHEFAGVLGRHFEEISRQAARRKDAAERVAALEAEMLRQADSIRSRFRAALVEGLPATCGADRPTLDELREHVPVLPLRMPVLRETVSLPRSAAAAALAAFVAALLPAVLLGWAVPGLALGLAVICGALGAGVAVWITCAPLSASARRWLFGSVVAAGAGTALLYALGGFGALFAALRRPGGGKRSLIVAGALAFFGTLRLWGRRLSLDEADIEMARDSLVAAFRGDLVADLHALALLAAAASRRPRDGEVPAALRENWKALQVEIAQAGRHPEGVVVADLLARCAELLGVSLEACRPEVERFVWTGSAEQKSRYIPRCIVRPGQRVRVTHHPVEERSEHGDELRVLRPGEVMPDEP